MTERLDKLLSDSGLYSRSEARAVVRAGRVSVDGAAITAPERKFSRECDIRVDGERLNCAKYRYFLLDKPEGYVCATEDSRLPTVLELLPEELRGDYAPYLLHPDPELEAVVKAADKLDAYLKCVKERKAGNGEFQTAQVQIWDALQANPLPALGYFIQHYLPSFELTLDQLNGSTHTMF